MHEDTKEDIDKASVESGARKILIDMVKNDKTSVKPCKIEDFYIKSPGEIPPVIARIEKAMIQYAAKVRAKNMFYVARDKTWRRFGPEDKDGADGEIAKVIIKIDRLRNSQIKDVKTFNDMVYFVYRKMIFGGME